MRVAGPTDLQHPATASTYTSDSQISLINHRGAVFCIDTCR